MVHVPEAVVVVPCYNESGRIGGDEFSRFVAAHPGVCFIFVDDGSTDGTDVVLSRLASGNPHAFRVIQLPANEGKAEAVRRGVIAAFELEPRYVGYWDADLATPLEMIPRFAAVLDERPDVELVMGSRVQLLGRHIERKAMRHYLGRVFATAVSLMFALRVYDTQCGAKLFRPSAHIRELFKVRFQSRWLLDVEVLARLAIIRAASNASPISRAIYEYPLVRWRDVARSKLSASDFAAAPWELVRIFFRYRGARKANRAT